MKKHIIKTITILCALFMALMNTSCEDLLSDPILNNNDELKLTVSSSEVILDERKPNENLTFNWTTGTNKGTSASINYVLQIDKEGKKVEIKTRRTPEGKSKVIFRNFEFDYCIYVELNEFYEPIQFLKIEVDELVNNLEKNYKRLSVSKIKKIKSTIPFLK